MEFMICDPDGLCRNGTDSGYDECLKNDKWCADGYAAGAFHGFESARRITEEEAVKVIMDDLGLSEEEAKAKLKEKGLGKEEAIAYVAKSFGYHPTQAAKALGFYESKTISKKPEW